MIMNDWIALLNFSMSASGLILMILGLLVVSLSKSMEQRTKKFFLLFFFILILYIGSNFIGQITDMYANLALITRILLFSESLFSSVLLLLLTDYLLWCCKENIRAGALMHIVFVLWLIYVFLLIFTQFSDKIYFITGQNVYHRGPWYAVLLIPPVLILLTDLTALIRRRHKLSQKQFAAFLIYLILPMAAMLLQMFFYGLFLIVLGTAVSAIFLFIFIFMDQMDAYSRQQREIARQQASIAVLQMRPHFICNTMMSIYYLCRQDPGKAQQVILDFSSYLRKNFTAIAKEDTIPFSDELEHVRAYLAVEQIRYEGMLHVNMDTPVTMFRIPALTLQPIVENAVKHGMDPEAEPLHISIRTCVTKNGVSILVDDNGPGFSPVDDREPHIALKNIRVRLEQLCEGRLEIESHAEGGTTVTVWIPDSSNAPAEL